MVFLSEVSGIIYNNILFAFFAGLFIFIFLLFWKGANAKKVLVAGSMMALGGLLAAFFLELASLRVSLLGQQTSQTLGGLGVATQSPAIVQLTAGFQNVAVLMFVLGIFFCFCAIALTTFGMIKAARGERTPGQSRPKEFRIHGQLTSGLAAIGADANPKVTLVGASQVKKPDRSGFFAFEGLGPAEYELIASADGYVSQKRHVKLSFIKWPFKWPIRNVSAKPGFNKAWKFQSPFDYGTNREVNFDLTLEDVKVELSFDKTSCTTDDKIKGTVKVSQGGRAIPNYTVEVNTTISDAAKSAGAIPTIDGEDFKKEFTTDSSGEITFELKCNRTCEVEVGAWQLGFGAFVFGRKGLDKKVKFHNPNDFVLEIQSPNRRSYGEGENLTIAASTKGGKPEGDVVAKIIRVDGNSEVDLYEFKLDPMVRGGFAFKKEISFEGFHPKEHKIRVTATRQGVTRTIEKQFKINLQRPTISSITPNPIRGPLAVGQTIDLEINGRHLVDIQRVEFTNGRNTFRFTSRDLVSVDPPQGQRRKLIVKFARTDTWGDSIVDGNYDLALYNSSATNNVSAPVSVDIVGFRSPKPVVGKVVNADTGTVAPGAKIELDGVRKNDADANGEFRFIVQPSDFDQNLTLKVSKNGVSKTVRFKIGDSPEPTKDLGEIKITSPVTPGTVIVDVRDSSNLAFVTAAMVIWERNGNQYSGTTYGNKYKISGVPVNDLGDGVLTVQAAGFIPSREHYEVKSGTRSKYVGLQKPNNTNVAGGGAGGGGHHPGLPGGGAGPAPSPTPDVTAIGDGLKEIGKSIKDAATALGARPTSTFDPTPIMQQIAQINAQLQAMQQQILNIPSHAPQGPVDFSPITGRLDPLVAGVTGLTGRFDALIQAVQNMNQPAAQPHVTVDVNGIRQDITTAVSTLQSNLVTNTNNIVQAIKDIRLPPAQPQQPYPTKFDINVSGIEGPLNQLVTYIKTIITTGNPASGDSAGSAGKGEGIPPQPCVYGFVTDEDTKEGIEGVRVYWNGVVAITQGKHGYYCIVPTNDYIQKQKTGKIIADHQEYDQYTSSDTFDLTKKSQYDHSFSMRQMKGVGDKDKKKYKPKPKKSDPKDDYVLYGTVYEEGDSPKTFKKPLDGVTVSWGADYKFTCVTGDASAGLKPGEYKITIKAVDVKNTRVIKAKISDPRFREYTSPAKIKFDKSTKSAEHSFRMPKKGEIVDGIYLKEIKSTNKQQIIGPMGQKSPAEVLFEFVSDNPAKMKALTKKVKPDTLSRYIRARFVGEDMKSPVPDIYDVAKKEGDEHAVYFDSQSGGAGSTKHQITENFTLINFGNKPTIHVCLKANQNAKGDEVFYVIVETSKDGKTVERIRDQTLKYDQKARILKFKVKSKPSGANAARKRPQKPN